MSFDTFVRLVVEDEPKGPFVVVLEEKNYRPVEHRFEKQWRSHQQFPSITHGRARSSGVLVPYVDAFAVFVPSRSFRPQTENGN
jgi:hypothetical protein